MDNRKLKIGFIGCGCGTGATVALTADSNVSLVHSEVFRERLDRSLANIKGRGNQCR